MITKSKKVLREIKIFRISVAVWILYYVIYNTLFGWNDFPESELEVFLDNITVIWGGLSVGMLIVAFISFMESVVNYIIEQTKNKQ